MQWPRSETSASFSDCGDASRLRQTRVRCAWERMKTAKHWKGGACVGEDQQIGPAARMVIGRGGGASFARQIKCLAASRP